MVDVFILRTFYVHTLRVIVLWLFSCVQIFLEDGLG